MRKRVFVELIVLFLLSLTPLLWLRGSQMLIGHDSGFRLIPWDHLKNLFYSWNPLIDYGRDWSLYKAFLITQFPETLFTILTGSVIWGQRFALIAWFFVISLGTWLGLYLVFPEKEHRFLRIWSATFAMYNFFILQGWLIAERAKFSLFAALPIAIALLYRVLVLEKSIVWHVLSFGLLYLFLNGGGSPPLYGATLVSLLGAFVWFSLVSIHRNGWKALRRSLYVGFGIVGIFIMFNAYWIVPQIALYVGTYSQALGDNGGMEGLISWEREISKNASILNLLRLQGVPDWYDNAKHSYSHAFLTNPFLILASFVPAILVVLSFVLLFFNRKKKENIHSGYLIFLLVLLAAGLILAAGSHPPFGFVFVWAMRHVPGFAIFRSSFYKFGPLVWFPIIILSGFALNYFLEKIKKASVRWAMGTVCIVGLLLYHYPFFRADIFSFYPPYTTRVSVPSYVFQMGEYVNANLNKDDRILELPALDSGYYNLLLDTTSWGYFSQDLLSRSIFRRSVVANDKGASQTIRSLYEAIQKNDRQSFERLAHMLGVTHVLWKDDAVYKSSYNDSRDIAVQKENVTQWNYPLVTSADKWQLYKIPNSNSITVSVSTNAVLASGDSINYGDILTSVIPGDTTFVIDELLPGTVIQQALSGVTHQAKCLYCRSDERTRWMQSVIVPDLVNPPDSILHTRMIKTQEQALQKANTPAARIDVQLIRADTALSVLKWRISHSEESKKDLAMRSFQEYMNDALQNFSTLTGRDQNEYAIRIVAFLEAQERYIKTISLNEQTALTLKDLIEGYREKVTADIWMTENNSEFKYELVIDADGEYQVTSVGQDRKIMIDGKALQGNVTQLKKGYHRLLVDNKKNLIDEPNLYFSRMTNAKGESEATVSFKKENPARYTVRIKSDKPYFLLLNEQFDRRWKLKINNSQLSENLHARANGYANAWYIDNTNSSDMTISYEPYDMFQLGIIISLFGFTGVAIVLLWWKKMH